MKFTKEELQDITDALTAGTEEIDEKLKNQYGDYSSEDIEEMKVQKKSFIELETKISKFLYK